MGPPMVFILIRSSGNFVDLLLVTLGQTTSELRRSWDMNDWDHNSKLQMASRRPQHASIGLRYKGSSG